VAFLDRLLAVLSHRPCACAIPAAKSEAAAAAAIVSRLMPTPSGRDFSRSGSLIASAVQ